MVSVVDVDGNLVAVRLGFPTKTLSQDHAVISIIITLIIWHVYHGPDDVIIVMFDFRTTYLITREWLSEFYEILCGRYSITNYSSHTS
jgi:hypothetical protein